MIYFWEPVGMFRVTAKIEVQNFFKSGSPYLASEFE